MICKEVGCDLSYCQHLVTSPSPCTNRLITALRSLMLLEIASCARRRCLD